VVTLDQDLSRRIAEFADRGSAYAWVGDVLPSILAEHLDYGGWCGVCKAGDPGIVGPFSRLQDYPCRTVEQIMAAVDFEPWQLAHTAIDALLNDVRAAGSAPLTVLRRPMHDDRDATTGAPRFAFESIFPGRGVFILMPGLPLAELQPAPGQGVRGVERIYVNGSSWFWPFAVKQLLEPA
jgi:hypothetical protein